MRETAGVRGISRLGLRGLNRDMPYAAQLRDGPLRHVGRQRPAMPAVFVLDLREAFAFQCPGDDDGRLACGLACPGKGGVDLLDVVAIDQYRESAEGLRPLTIDVNVPAVLGLATLAEPVDVEYGCQVGEPVVPGLVDSLPDRALCQLGIAAKGPDVEGQLVQVHTRQGDPDCDRQALTKRACGNVHPRYCRCGMPLKP